MASIARDKNGSRRILFVATDGRRPTIRLGKVSHRAAEGFKHRVEQLLEARTLKQPMDADLTNWVAGLGHGIAAKLAKAGLIAARESVDLGAFLDSYIAVRSDVKGSTATVYGHTRRCLVEFFGAERPLGSITPGDADEWRIWLAEHEGLAPNTVARRSGIAKQFFRAAVRKRLIQQSPFADLKAGIKKNTARHYFVTREQAKAVLNACPDAEWRLLFALSRFGGLRCPSEHLAPALG